MTDVSPSRPAADDPVAATVSWSRMEYGGFATRAYRLVFDDRGCRRRATLLHVLYLLGGLALGVGFFVLGPLIDSWVLRLLGIATLAGTAWRARDAFRRCHFDLEAGVLRHWERAVPLSEVHALQVLRERVQEGEHTFDSWELNVVLRSGARLHVLDHGALGAFDEEAGRLGLLLGVPVWSGRERPPA